MATSKKTFEAAAKQVQKLAQRPNNAQLLELYALYKQATEGDVTGSRPGFLDMTGRAKFDAWAKKQGVASDKAMQSYVDYVAKLQKS